MSARKSFIEFYLPGETKFCQIDKIIITTTILVNLIHRCLIKTTLSERKNDIKRKCPWKARRTMKELRKWEEWRKSQIPMKWEN